MHGVALTASGKGTANNIQRMQDSSKLSELPGVDQGAERENMRSKARFNSIRKNHELPGERGGDKERKNTGQ